MVKMIARVFKTGKKRDLKDFANEYAKQAAKAASQLDALMADLLKRTQEKG